MNRYRKNQELLQEDEGEINLSPLLDMVFILLIFFVVTTTFTRETGVDVKKPTASKSIALKDNLIKIAITREGSIHVHEKQVDLTELANLLKQEKNRFPNLKVVILADKNSITQRLVEVIDVANISGLPNTSIGVVK